MRRYWASFLAFSSCVTLCAAEPQTTFWRKQRSEKKEEKQKETTPQVFLDVAFLYYMADEGGLDLANSGMLQEATAQTGYLTVATSNGKTLFQSSSYQPSFQVGLEVDFGKWNVEAEYTWIRQSTTKTSGAPVPQPNTGPGVWIMNNWFQQLSEFGQALAATKVSSHWNLGMDLVDLAAQRSLYEGHRLTLTPFFGLRGAWIRQHVNVKATVSPLVFANLTRSTVISHNSSTSWGLGPRVGLNTAYDLGDGFCVEATLGTSLLFTQYNEVGHSETVANSVAAPSKLKAHFSNYNTLRPELDLGLGFGWSTPFNNGENHLDILATYQFIEFWEQNMIRKLMDQVVQGTGAAAGNLYLQGLSLAVSLDF